jgi:hypothetical protein
LYQLLVLFTFKNSKKGVYYNWHFTDDNSDSAGWLIFLIIILLQYNIAKTNIIAQKRLSLTNLGVKIGVLRNWKVWFSGKKSQQYKK